MPRLSAQSPDCNRQSHGDCSLIDCDCICHIYKPKMHFPIVAFVGTIALVWGALFLFGYIISLLWP